MQKCLLGVTEAAREYWPWTLGNTCCLSHTLLKAWQAVVAEWWACAQHMQGPPLVIGCIHTNYLIRIVELGQIVVLMNVEHNLYSQFDWSVLMWTEVPVGWVGKSQLNTGWGGPRLWSLKETQGSRLPWLPHLCVLRPRARQHLLFCLASFSVNRVVKPAPGYQKCN